MFPLPNLVDKGIPPQLVSGDTLFFELFFHDGLSGDPGVIRSWKPEGIIAAHSLPADEEILNRVIQGVTHVQEASDIGRRQNDRVGRLCRFVVGLEVPRAFPVFVDAGFNVSGIVSVIHLFAHGEATLSYPETSLKKGAPPEGLNALPSVRGFGSFLDILSPRHFRKKRGNPKKVLLDFSQVSGRIHSPGSKMEP